MSGRWNLDWFEEWDFRDFCEYAAALADSIGDIRVRGVPLSDYATAYAAATWQEERLEHDRRIGLLYETEETLRAKMRKERQRLAKLRKPEINGRGAPGKAAGLPEWMPSRNGEQIPAGGPALKRGAARTGAGRPDSDAAKATAGGRDKEG